ncbi:DUF354 domain-containing protein [Flavihumibacter solisilvae]|uniref:DUF354 domain-containing protein n=1 Tax=Flavihumibacter solisilvae TaxID=1349421 RepID=UPI000692390E|nr:DUF354 domain-containing protein [Flavihumibacter solisilvae]
MRILVDIGHPAHVHYFRNAIRQLHKEGHQFLITTRDKEVTLELLENYGFNYVCTGKNLSGRLNKLYSMVRNDLAIYRAARKFRPDLFLSFYTPFAAQVGRFMNKPVIGFMDSEFDHMRIKLTKPFTDYTFTPNCYQDDFGKNHFRFNGYMETFYLHPAYFKPDPAILARLGVKEGDPFFIVRFVAFNAGHDRGEHGMDDDSKTAIIEYLQTKGKVFISAEKDLPAKLSHLKFSISPKDFHSALYYSSMYIGEGITTASECAHLGTPAVLINTIRASYIREQEQLGLVHQFENSATALPVIRKLVEEPGLKENYRAKSLQMVHGQMNCTEFLVQLIHKFPKSIHALHKDQLIGSSTAG